MDKQTLITNPTCWVILIWHWPLYDIDRQGHIFLILLNSHLCMVRYFTMNVTFIWFFNFAFIVIHFNLWMDLTCIWRKQQLWPNRYVDWFWHNLNLCLTLNGKDRYINFALIVITFSFIGVFYLNNTTLVLADMLSDFDMTLAEKCIHLAAKQIKKLSDVPAMRWLMLF